MQNIFAEVNILKGKLLKDPSAGLSFCISGVLWAKYVSRYDLTGVVCFSRDGSRGRAVCIIDGDQPIGRVCERLLGSAKGGGDQGKNTD